MTTATRRNCGQVDEAEKQAAAVREQLKTILAEALLQ
jgi:hypothetical protein